MMSHQDLESPGLCDYKKYPNFHEENNASMLQNNQSILRILKNPPRAADLWGNGQQHCGLSMLSLG